MFIDEKELLTHIPQARQRYDVIVVGGGNAGIGAAIAAALTGAKVLVIEGRSHFGGTGYLMNWMPMNRMRLKSGEQLGKTHQVFLDALRKYGEDAIIKGKENKFDGSNYSIHPDYLRFAIFEMLESVGADYVLFSPVCGVVKENDRVTGVICQTKSGKVAYYADIVIDASGDADVAYMAGAQMIYGEEGTGKTMEPALGFVVCNADAKKFIDYTLADQRADFNRVIDEYDAKGYAVAKWYQFDMATVSGAVSVNNGGMRHCEAFNAVESDKLTLGERMGMAIAIDFIQIARDAKLPGLENCQLMRVGDAVAVRESRRIVGEYTMTVEDSWTERDFEDAILRRYCQTDRDKIPGKQPAEYKLKMHSGHTFPYRCLIPKGLEGLLVAGRCASATHLGGNVARSMGTMIWMGQAAGIAAAMCAKEKCGVRDVDIKRVQQTIRDFGYPL